LSKFTVAVGTSNDMKVRAVSRAFKRYFDCEVVKVAVETSVPAQPVGARQLVQGALERALKSLERVSDASYGVGIEAGLMEFFSSTGYLETQVAVIVGPGRRVSVGLSPSFELPPEIVDRMLNGLELSSASNILRGKRDIGEDVGYIGVKTWGAVTRGDLTELAVRMALLPWLERSEWLITLEEFLSQLGLKEI